ncbi:RING finger protein unkempt homolog [Clonorchis sinensis]|uniref:RING finger protein unkempt homolog n=1 Tax=Clonorchis sinensis TaxID=79923 RepID=G7Y4D4_CLOSI|nr:RING finger protein unkempt homolog [Clonorchis sinensis]
MLFLEQQCQFHRPYTCFHWHFPNQKRRRPFKRPDGTFNYNPDVYCDKYDETTGSCVEGDDCPYAHRNAGDTERRYHPRYFKTGNCIYETTDNGACVKNGLHCAFAHGPDDIRLPVYDIREVQDASSKFTINLPASLEKERVLSEDPKWNQMFHVLACYKTDLCKKPPRMCRQGYSCPFYHNGKDKRRAPDKWRYRSTPCPSVRPGDEWQDSSLCEAGDACGYCHTRTEQQFHPEIYKSTKCNDVINSGYCPRGPFCAFAHCDSELSTGRDFLAKLQAHLSLSSKSLSPSSASTEGVPANVPRSFGSAPSGRMHPVVGYPQAVAQANPSGQLFERTSYLLSFVQGEGGQGANEAVKRSSQVPTPLISNLLPAFGPVGNAPNSMVVGRGRRVGRCVSPHQNAGIWQPPNNSNVVSERHASLSAQRNFSSNLACSPETSSTASSASVNPNQFQLPFYSARQQVNPLTNVLTTKPGFGDKGRHRSGNSVCSENGLSMTSRDSVASSSPIANPTSVYTFTYPGCSSAFGLPNASGSIRPVCSGIGPSSRSPNVQQLLRTGQRKQSQQYPYQENGQVLGLSGNSHASIFPASRSHSQAVGDGLESTFDRSMPMPNSSVHFLRGDIWSHQATTTTLSTSDSHSTGHFLASPWPWQTAMDSGNNSETSGNDADISALLDLPGSVVRSSASAAMASSSLLDTSNRDSGLVLDFSLPHSGSNVSEPAECSHNLSGSVHADEHINALGESQRHGLHTGSEQPDYHQMAYKSLTEASGKTSEPPRVPSGLFDDLHTLYQCFMPPSNDPALKHDDKSNSDAGFQSPLDDILLHTQSGFENVDYSPGSNVPLNRCSSSPRDTAESDPVSIPRRYMFEQPDSSVHQHDTSGTIAASRPTQPSYSVTQSNRISPKSTWPVNFTEPHGTTRSASNLSSPATSQISQSFSPVVGTPVLRSHQKPMFDLGCCAKSALANIARDAVSQVSVVPHSHGEQPESHGDSKPETTNTPPLSPEACAGTADASATTHATSNVNFLHLPQSPILMSSPFSNPRSELERLSLQRELDEVRQRLGSKEHEVEALKRQRDFMTEHLRDSLGVIRQLFSTLNVSSSDISRPLFVDTEAAGTGSGQSTGYSTTGFTNSESSPLAEIGELDSSVASEDSNVQITTAIQTPSTVLNVSEKTQLQQQQEALAALFANPFVSALINSGTLPVTSHPQHMSSQLWNSQCSSSTTETKSDVSCCLVPTPERKQGKPGSSNSDTFCSSKPSHPDQPVCSDNAFAHLAEDTVHPQSRG